MAAISQKYNTYLQGMSDQPDEIMKPGQLKDSLNTFPDVTFGLLKRPGLGFTRALDTPDHVGCWGSYYRVSNTGTRDEYLLQVLRNGRIRIFDANTGVRQTVNIGGTLNNDGTITGGSTADDAVLNYGVHTNDADIQFTTILDTTIINNRTINPRMDATRGAINQVGGDWYAFPAITQLAYGQSYTLEFQHGTNAVQKVSYNTPTTGSTAVNVETVLDNLVTAINGLDNDDMGGTGTGTDAFFQTVVRIGNGIYIQSDQQFTVNTPELQLFDIIAVGEDDEDPPGTVVARYAVVQNVAQLPLECRNGMIVKVANSFTEDDDYYVVFNGNQGVDGEGVWEETVKPGLYNEFEETLMPHSIVRGPINAGVYTFVANAIDWDDREVGDELTNPYPSFINSDDPDSTNNTNPIERVIFYRNRLCLLAGENVIMSRPGDYFNFWSLSALNVSVSDPIDTAASSTYSSLLLDGIVVNSGLVLFSEFQQFLLTTDSDLLSPQTVKISNLATYDFNPKTFPFSMGNTIGFVSTAGINSRLYEMFNIFREGEPDVIEQSKILNRRFADDMTLIADSKENGFIMFAEQDASDIFCYRYYNQGNERLQSAWFRWSIIGDLQYHDIMGDNWFGVVVEIDSGGTERISLLNMDLSERFSTTDLRGEAFDYRVHMDYSREVANADLTFNDPNTSPAPANPNTTEFTLPIPNFTNNHEMYAYTLDNGGRYSEVTIDGTTGRVPGNWTQNNGTLIVGYNYRMEVDFPRVYLNSDPAKGGITDTTASLTVHRCKLSMGPQGVYQTVLTRQGKDNYTVDYESRFNDTYKANSAPNLAHRINTIPVYEKNYNYSLSLRSEHPSPCTLYSMSWEGMYSSLNYRRV